MRILSSVDRVIRIKTTAGLLLSFLWRHGGAQEAVVGDKMILCMILAHDPTLQRIPIGSNNNCATAGTGMGIAQIPRDREYLVRDWEQPVPRPADQQAAEEADTVLHSPVLCSLLYNGSSGPFVETQRVKATDERRNGDADMEVSRAASALACTPLSETQGLESATSPAGDEILSYRCSVPASVLVDLQLRLDMVSSI
ncbi:hypothetical protein AXG93_955s1000 [Marchantia polymorpha subsp. ruderalis]|uniref:Uncharacterized protein n=1 Tax=Marchantia polymorpha subsp. ruderalis TaxID=1480154 RepID=A0A176WKL2_MARPO|nr:hypothetical protein AXG93_955s1000 [Marchantia polymorpha subsp. ruderalis]